MTFHNMGWHGINWEFMAVYDQPRLLKSSEIFWTSFFRWWEVGFLVALVEGSVCFGNFGGQDKGQWYLIGPSPDPLQTWGVWYFFILYSGMMWDVFWFLWYFGHQFWGDWCLGPSSGPCVIDIFGSTIMVRCLHRYCPILQWAFLGFPEEKCWWILMIIEWMCCCC